MQKMATYPGMQLRGEIRESISLDEDDMSDVEDEVFIRHGKNGYKLADEITVKRPLMAPRRKAKPDISLRLRNKPPCRVFCKPCCYVFSALSILIGLIVLVVILVSIFPLPLDKVRDWIVTKSRNDNKKLIKLLPCTNFKVTDVWATNLPKLTSESPVRTLDVDGDGTEDIIFGFGTGDNYDVMDPESFCPIFMGVPAPCEGGVIALNGLNGELIWRHWLNDSIFNLQCTEDVNRDGNPDCLAVGKDGTITVLNSQNGTTIWQLNTGRLNIFVANFVPDQNNDNISDIIASHSLIEGGKKDGHIILFSGKNGDEIKRIKTPNGAKSFYMPQILKQNGTLYTIFGTGGPNNEGNLFVSPIVDIVTGNWTNTMKTLYRDTCKGMLTQSVLADINEDSVPDIITAMYNSTLVAINGKTFKQIWNFTVPNGETSVTPTPAFFNSDDIPDFLIIYQKYDNILNYNYTQTFIIDGKTGKSIYQPVGKSLSTQSNGLTLSSEGLGFDSYLFWTSECADYDPQTNKRINENLNDNCLLQYNVSSAFKLNALNQFHQPPGFLIYSSANRSDFEFNNTKSTLKILKEYFQKHPRSKSTVERGQSEVNENYNVDSPIGIRKYGSVFRHKDNRNGIVKDFKKGKGGPPVQATGEQDSYGHQKYENPKFESDYDWQAEPIVPEEAIDDFNYNLDTIPYNQKEMLFENVPKTSSRDPRSKEKKINTKTKAVQKNDTKQGSSKKKNLSDTQHGMYDYENIKKSRGRLLHDINNLPADILRDTYLKNVERKLRKSKFEQRDILSHIDKAREDLQVDQAMEEEKQAIKNRSLNLWDLEGEKELQDRENGLYRGKRNTNSLFKNVKRITSVGAVLKSFNSTQNFSSNSIDVVFIIYWQPESRVERDMLQTDIKECVAEKLLKSNEDSSHEFQKTTPDERRALYKSECQDEQTNLKKDFEFFNRLYQLRLGQMTVYRLRITCECDKTDVNVERCARFLPYKYQSWPEYLGKMGNGVFKQEN